MVTTSPRIYVACLASYNNGVLHGEWIDAAQDVDDIRAEIAEMLRDSKYPNVMVDCPECGDMVQSTGTKCECCGDTGKVPSAEEYAVHDFEGFGTWKMGEHPDLEQVAAFAELMDRLDEDDAEAFGAWFSNETRDITDADSMEEEFREVYRGKFDSLADYAEQLAEECGSIPKDLPDFIRFNIDWKGVAHDMQCNGDVWTHEAGGDVYVFENR